MNGECYSQIEEKNFGWLYRLGLISVGSVGFDHYGMSENRLWYN